MKRTNVPKDGVCKLCKELVKDDYFGHIVTHHPEKIDTVIKEAKRNEFSLL